MRPLQKTCSLFLSGCLVSAGLVSTGCTPAAPPPMMVAADPGAEAITYELKRPILTSLGSSEVALGDSVKVFGKDFIDDKHGVLVLHAEGTFRTENGVESRWAGDVPLTYVGPGQATFEFGPDVIFGRNSETPGLDLGSFRGTFQLVATLKTAAVNAEPGDVVYSDVQTLEMVAKPSIYIEQLRSVDDNCQAVTKGTTPGSNLAIGVRALGIPKATAAAPLKFSFVFVSPTVALSFAEDKVFSTWPLTTSPSAMLPVGAGNYTVSKLVKDGSSVLLDPLHYQEVVEVNPPVQVNPNVLTSTVKLARLAAGEMPKATVGMNQDTMNFIVRVSQPDGTELVRTIPMQTSDAVELLPWNQVEVIKEVYPMVQATCRSGGLTGQQYTYSDGDSESRTTSLNMSWNTQTNVSATATANFLAIQAQLSASSTQIFGVDVNKAITSESHTGNQSAINVLPGWVGASFRQPIRLERRTSAIVHNTCGVAIPVGDAVFTNWRWNADINQGPNCEEVKPSPEALEPGPR